ncbi:MAG: response regulator [Polyangiales bacterium]
MPTVLVVEDEPMLRASMVRGLSKLSGVSVLAAGSVDEANAIISATVPQLLITDLNLPDRSGLEVIAELDRIGARVPIVIASAYLRRFKVPQRPGIVVLEKPVALANLREVVVEQLGLRDVAAPFTLADYIQLASMGRRSVRLDVSRDGKQLGEVVIHRGEAWHARDEGGQGVEAFSRLVAATGVTVGAHPMGVEIPRTLTGSCEALLLDSLRRQDEVKVQGEGEEFAFAELGRVVGSRPPQSRPAPSRPTPARPMPYPIQSEPAPPKPVTPRTVEPGPMLRETPGSRPITPAPRAIAPEQAPPSATRSLSFEVLYAKGVEALLDRRYQDAYEAFEAASRVGASPSLTANLARLRTMGFGT